MDLSEVKDDSQQVDVGFLGRVKARIDSGFKKYVPSELWFPFCVLSYVTVTQAWGESIRRECHE